jgi:hypothetical protein
MKNIKIILIFLLFFSCSSGTETGSDSNDSTTDTTSFSSLINIVDEAGGDNCTAGGVKIETGLDNGDGDGTANDGILQSGEIDSTEYVCNGENGSDGEDATSDQVNDSTTDSAKTYRLSGKAQKGKCMQNAEVLAWPLDDGTVTQTGAHFIDFTGENGTYNIIEQINDDEIMDYALVCYKGWCDDEANGGDTYQELCGIRKTSDPISNINPLTKIAIPVVEDLFGSGFGTVEECLVEAERLTLEFLSMPTADRFGTMDLENDSTGDQVLALTSSMVLHGRTGDGEAGDFMSTISTGIINNDLVLKAEILESYGELPLIRIKNNLESSYSHAPKFWRLMAPDYYMDLLENDQIITGSFNLGDTAGCSFDQSTFNTFAIPYVFESWIEISEYLALNISGDISIWTHTFDGYDRPGTKILDIEQLREKLLDSDLEYHGKLGDHGLTVGTWYYIYITRDENFTLSTGCDGGLLAFGRKLASQDNGETWIGHDNDSFWFKYSGVVAQGLKTE